MTAAVRKRTAKRGRKVSSGAIHSRADTVLRRRHPDVWKVLLQQAHGQGLTVEPAVPQDQTISTRLYGISEAAQRIGVAAYTLAEWKRKGYLIASFCIEVPTGMQSLYTDRDVERGKIVRGQTKPGRQAISTVGTKNAHNIARAKMRELYEAEHREIVEKLRSGEL